MELGSPMRLGYLPGHSYSVPFRRNGGEAIHQLEQYLRFEKVHDGQHISIQTPNLLLFKVRNPISSNTALIHHARITLLPSTVESCTDSPLPSPDCFL